MDDGKLIILVQGFSVLYNQQHAEYRNNGVKENSWKIIATDMDLPGNNFVIYTNRYRGNVNCRLRSDAKN